MEYVFVVKWVPAKTHHITDAQSRAPLFSPKETEDIRVDTARACLVATPVMESELDMIFNVIDSDYIKLRHNIVNSTETSDVKQLRTVFSHLCIDDDLVYIDAKRIVMPIAAIKDILRLVHATHSGITKTYWVRIK